MYFSKVVLVSPDLDHYCLPVPVCSSFCIGGVLLGSQLGSVVDAKGLAGYASFE